MVSAREPRRTRPASGPDGGLLKGLGSPSKAARQQHLLGLHPAGAERFGRASARRPREPLLCSPPDILDSAADQDPNGGSEREISLLSRGRQFFSASFREARAGR